MTDFKGIKSNFVNLGVALNYEPNNINNKEKSNSSKKRNLDNFEHLENKHQIISKLESKKD